MKFAPISRITLPSKLPHEKAMKSKHDYDPEFWEFDYARFDYLTSVPDDELFRRHKSIIKNMQSLTSPDRHIIPINVFLSSWYWYKKEHQTRYEIARRALPLPVIPSGLPLSTPTNHHLTLRPSSPNSESVLYRFTEPKFAEALLRKGSLYLKCASQMALHDKNESRFDIETSKSSYSSPKHIKVTNEDGKDFRLLGNLTRTTSFPDYYLFCLSTDYDPVLLNELGGACVIIKDPETFSARLEEWGNKNLPGWRFDRLCVHYFDPYEDIQGFPGGATISKRFEFAYQRECRFLFTNLSGTGAMPIPPIEIGSIEDIAEIAQVV